MKTFLNILKVFFSTLLIILIINLTGVVVIDTLFEIKTNQPNNNTVKNDDEEYSSEMRDIGELFGLTEETADVSFNSLNQANIQNTPQFGTSNLFITKNSTTKNSNYANEIYNKYYGILTSMQGSYQSRAQSIVETAKAEYNAAVDAGEDAETAKQNIYSKYISPLSDLMNECDNAVEGVLSQMSNELASAGLDTSYVSELRNIYGSIVSGYSSRLQ